MSLSTTTSIPTGRRARVGLGLLAAGTTLGVAGLVGAGPAVAAPSQADQTFITANAQSNLAEMTLGQLVLQKGQSSQVRDLAQMTIADHQTAMQQLTTVAQQLGVTLPTALNAMQQQAAATLQSTAAGNAFDLAYAQIQVQGHQLSISDTNTELSSGSDASVKTYAQGYLPVATKHLQMANDAVVALGGTPGSVPAGTGGQAATSSSSTSALGIGLAAGGAVLAIGAGVGLARRRRVTS